MPDPDQTLEAAIVAAGASAPRITLDDLTANIAHTEIVKYVSITGQVLRWAVLTTSNGFAVTGKPSCSVSSQNDRVEIGEEIAVKNAREELRSLMGYALKQRLHEDAQRPVLTLADSIADLNGTPRPDFAALTAQTDRMVSEKFGAGSFYRPQPEDAQRPVLTMADSITDREGQPRPDSQIEG
jgi:hypothetical protein